MTDTDESGEADRIHSIDSLAQRVDKLAIMFEKFLGGARKDAGEVTQARLEAPDDIRSEVEKELARRDAETRQREKDELLGKHEETLKSLTEQKPETPLNWGGRIMGWNKT
jgi:hypothetical protein